jgi:hypothetical protein
VDRNRQWKRSGNAVGDVGSSKDKERWRALDRWRPLKSSTNKRIKGFQEVMVVIGLDNEKAVKAVAVSVYCHRRTQAARSLPPAFACQCHLSPAAIH